MVLGQVGLLLLAGWSILMFALGLASPLAGRRPSWTGTRTRRGWAAGSWWSSPACSQCWSCHTGASSACPSSRWRASPLGSPTRHCCSTRGDDTPPQATLTPKPGLSIGPSGRWTQNGVSDGERLVEEPAICCVASSVIEGDLDNSGRCCAHPGGGRRGELNARRHHPARAGRVVAPVEEIPVDPASCVGSAGTHDCSVDLGCGRARGVSTGHRAPCVTSACRRAS